MGNDAERTPDKIELSQIPWTLRDVIAGTLLVIALTVLLLSLIIGILAFLYVSGTDWVLDTWFILIVAGIPLYAAMLFAVWFFSVRKYSCRWQELGLRSFKTKRALILSAVVVAVGVAISTLYEMLMKHLGMETPSALPSDFTGTWYAWAVLGFFAIVVAPVAEEIFFRGFLFTGISRHYGYAWGALASAVLFSMAHMQPGALVPIFILGFLLAWLYMKTGSIWACIIAHFTYNCIALSSMILYY